MIINNIPTPFFLIDLPTLSQEIGKLRKACDFFWPQTTIAYSVKTNSLPYLAKFLCEQRIYAEVVSQDEYDLVKLCGYTDDKIVCNGPVKSYELVSQLMESHAIINIDSHRELDYVIKYASNNPHCNYSIGLRVNIDVDNIFPNESKAGIQGSRFGFCIDNNELNNAISLLRLCPNLSISGLHLHVSTRTRRVDIYRWLSSLFVWIVEQYHLDKIEYFDIGGGFYGGIPGKPQWEDYLKAISEELSLANYNGDNLRLILEPGVSLLAGAFRYYTTVVDVKNTTRCRFVVTNGSRIQIDPFFHKTSYYYKHYSTDKNRKAILPKQILVGFTCLEYDNLMELNNYDEILIGDTFCFEKIGAYTLSLSPQFISFSPAVYAISSNGEIKCVRRKLTAQDFIRGSYIGNNLKEV